MSMLRPIIEEIISSIEDIDTVVTSFKKGYVDNVQQARTIYL